MKKHLRQVIAEDSTRTLSRLQEYYFSSLKYLIVFNFVNKSILKKVRERTAGKWTLNHFRSHYVSIRRPSDATDFSLLQKTFKIISISHWIWNAFDAFLSNPSKPLSAPTGSDSWLGFLSALNLDQRQALQRDFEVFLSEGPSFIFPLMHRDHTKIIGHNNKTLSFSLHSWLEN